MTEELLKEIRRVSEALLTDGALQNERNNKAAGVRARKASLELERLTKAFRKASLETDKERNL
ncbi:MAG: histone H1 [Bacteroidetes bacterium]|uniref:Histone H1 n=1 Tax=Candidatus Pullibacteroides excrementavium TaxID=2840905 RepID=A0A9D9DTD5_9BACT|nr:histone H1 [Candidatus Pullibacteroides excrementavium]